MLYYKHSLKKLNVILLSSEESQEHRQTPLADMSWYSALKIKGKHIQDIRASGDKVNRQDSPAHGVIPPSPNDKGNLYDCVFLSNQCAV